MTATAQFPATTVHRRRFDGQVLTPDTRGYDSARSVWNAMIDHRPKLIVQCASVGDVVTAVRTARERGLETTARNVSHTGVGGLTLGGGMGWLARQHGLACDKVVYCTVVTADGDVVRASA